MRYTVGDKVPFVKVRFHEKNGNLSWGNLFHPQFHILDEIEVKMLEVVEHHEVPIEHYEEKADGFILKEIDSDQIWYNQYPTAAYGQTDDSLDRKVWRRHDHFTEEEVIKMSKSEIDYWLEYWDDALALLSNIYRAVHGPEDIRLKFEMGYRKEFIQYLNQLRSKIEEVSGKKVTFKELSYVDRTGETHTIPKFWEAKFK